MDFEYSFEPVREQDIAQFEEKHGTAFPEDYRHFLLQHNGGKPVKRRFHTKNGKITTSLMLCFPLSSADEPNLEAKYAEYTLSGIVPSRFVPIGSDPLDSPICLSIAGEDRGKVYFCDMDYFEEDGELKEEFIYPVADSFTELQQLLFQDT